MDFEHLRTTRSIANLKRGRNDWYRIENKAGSAPKIYIYDEIGYFGVTATDFVKDLNAIDATEIDLRLNTPGGNVFDGLTIFNGLRDHPARVIGTVDGLAASAGAFILQAADDRIMNKGTQLMIHQAQGGGFGLKASDMRELADLLDKQSDNVARIFADRSGVSVGQIRQAMDDETWYSDEEAVKAGLADDLAGSDAVENSFDLSIFSYAGRSDAPEPQMPEPKPGFDHDSISDALRRAFA